MIYIFHGDNALNSRTAFMDQLTRLKDSNTRVLHQDSKNFKFEIIFQFLATKELFATQKILILENFFALSPALKQTLTPLLATNKNPILLWEAKTLSQSQLKTFPTAKSFAFPVNRELFRFFDHLKPQTPSVLTEFTALCQQEPIELILFFLKKHLRLLIMACHPTSSTIQKLPSWKKAKLTSQAKLFPKVFLKLMYKKLIVLELQHKTGTHPLVQTLPNYLFGLLMLS